VEWRAVGRTAADKVCKPGNTRRSLLCFEEGLHERAPLGRVPPACADDTPDHLALPVDEVEGGRSPDAVDAPGDVAAPVDQDGWLVAPLLDRLADERGILTEVDQANFQTAVAECLVQRADGR
jgi:hypothetical protein